MDFKKCFHPDILITLSVLFVASLPFAFSDLDISISSFFYNQGWSSGDRGLWHWLYRFGTLPGLIFAVLALCGLIGSWIWPQLSKHRRPAAIIVLTLLIGPGLLINALGKQYWGRPRPRDVVQFQGGQTFQRFCQPGTPGNGHSFPCGHASVGFLLTALYFTSRNKKMAWAGLAGGLGYGTLMGIARIAQGGHFASDVLWSGGLTFLAAALSHHVILPLNPPSPTARPNPRKRFWAILGLAASLLGLLFFFLLATPFYKTWSDSLPDLGPEILAVRFAAPAIGNQMIIRQAEQIPAIQVQAEVRGFGFPKLKLQGEIIQETSGNILTVDVKLGFNFPVTEQHGKITYTVRPDLTLIKP